mgnify:CR=1 FL=1
MENFNQLFTFISNEEVISYNEYILESGLINITIMIAILITLGRDFLGSILEKRENDITRSIQDAEDRLDEANRRLSEAQKQLSQAHVVISEIRNETRSAKTNLLKSDANIAKKELVTRFNRAIATFRSKERVIFLEVKQQIISLVLNRSASQAKETFGSKKRARALINETIQKLEGDLL